MLKLDLVIDNFFLKFFNIMLAVAIYTPGAHKSIPSVLREILVKLMLILLSKATQSEECY